MSRATADRLRKVLAYDPDTGIFTRLVAFHRTRWEGKTAGGPGTRGYISIRFDGQRYKAHRLAWLYVHGEWPSGHLDHINGAPSDNRIANLRIVTDKQNTWNRKRHITNKSGFKGVSRKPRLRSTPWVANIQLDGVQVYLGCFATPEEAHVAYQKAARKHFGTFARSE